jgi:hypothetical protein
MSFSRSSLKESEARSQSIALNETEDVIRQGIPMMEIHGLYGQRMLAYAIHDSHAVAGELPKVGTRSAFMAQDPVSTLNKLDGQLMQGVQLVRFKGTRYVPGPFPGSQFPEQVECRVLGVPLPPDPEPFTVAHLGGNRWLVRGGDQTFYNQYLVADDPNDGNPDPNIYSTTTITMRDQVLTGRRGWIVLTAAGKQANPNHRESNFVPETLKFELVPRLDSTFSFTNGTGSNEGDNDGTSSASMGYFPIAWVAAAGEVEALHQVGQQFAAVLGAQHGQRRL